MKDSRDSKRYTIAPFCIWNPPESDDYDRWDEHSYYGYFLRQSQEQMQYHQNKQDYRQNLAGHWFVVPRNSKHEFTKFGEPSSLQQLHVSDYQYYGVRLPPFPPYIVDIDNACNIIPNFKNSLPLKFDIFYKTPSKKEMLNRKRKKQKPNPEIEKATQYAEFKKYKYRFWKPDSMEFEDFWNDIPELNENCYDLRIFAIPHRVLQACANDKYLKDYVQSASYFPLNATYDSEQFQQESIKINDKMEDIILPKIVNEIAS